MSALLAWLASGALQATPAAAGSMRASACAVASAVLKSTATDPPEVFDGDGLHKPFVPDLATDAPPALRRAPPSNLFQTCPALRDHLPPGARFATADDLRAASRGAPPPGAGPLPPAPPVVWYSAPVFSRGRAYVISEYFCPGLCGGGSLHVFSRVSAHGPWRLDPPPRPLWNS